MSTTPNSTPPSQKPGRDRTDDRKSPQQQGTSGASGKQQGGPAETGRASPADTKR